MKDNYLGNILIALAVGTLIFFAGAHACESYPFLARWMGGSCWLQPSAEDIAESSLTSMSSVAQGYYLQAKTFQASETDDEVIKAAIYALAQTGTAEAIATLKDLAEKHDKLEIRKAAIYALGQIGGEDTMEILVNLASSGHHVSVRKAAVYALQSCDSEMARQALYKILARVSK